MCLSGTGFTERRWRAQVRSKARWKICVGSWVNAGCRMSCCTKSPMTGPTPWPVPPYLSSTPRQLLLHRRHHLSIPTPRRPVTQIAQQRRRSRTLPTSCGGPSSTHPRHDVARVSAQSGAFLSVGRAHLSVWGGRLILSVERWSGVRFFSQRVDRECHQRLCPHPCLVRWVRPHRELVGVRRLRKRPSSGARTPYKLEF